MVLGWEREAKVLKLATPAQLNHLHERMLQYSSSVKASVDALSPLSEYLSTEPLKTDWLSRDEIKRLNGMLKTEIDRERTIRLELIEQISVILSGN